MDIYCVWKTKRQIPKFDIMYFDYVYHISYVFRIP